MDILQQSLQAADILSGEGSDLFGELGLSFSNTSTENAGLGEEFPELGLPSQADGLYNNGNGGNSQQSNYLEFNRTQDATSLSSFDTSQFLNTSASIMTPTSQTSSTDQYGFQNQQVSNSFANEFTPTSMQFSSHQLACTTSYQFSHGGQIQNQSTNSIAQCNTSSITSQSVGTVRTSITKPGASNAGNFLPTQKLTMNDHNRPLTPVANTNQSLPPGIVIANAKSLESSTIVGSNMRLDNVNAVKNEVRTGMRPVTPVQNYTNSASQNPRQLVTLVQKPNLIGNSTVNQNVALRNGISLQTQSNITNPNVAVLKVAGTKQSINITDPQLVKALTSNLVHKQQQSVVADQKSDAPQFIKLDQTNTVINVVPQRTQQQPQLRGLQQITLQNGQTILLNNGQQVQLCTSQSQPGQLQVVQPSAQTAVSSFRNMNQQNTKNGQLPIKGIQIASVSIPVASSSTNTTSVNVNSVSGGVLAIPVLTKQELGHTNITTTSTTTQVTMSQTISSRAQNSATVRSLLANSILKQNNTTNLSTAQAQQVTLPTVTSNAAQLATPQRSQIGTTLRLNLTPQQASQLTPAQLQAILKQHRATLQARALPNGDSKTTNSALVGQSIAQTSTTSVTAQPVPGSLAAILRPTSTSSMVTSANNSAVINKTATTPADQPTVQLFRVDPTLTEAQVEEVKKLLANRTIASKLNSLTREQQQLVLAFQAQIKAMSPPVQQYYLRNPQLFMQKVLNQIRAGKPFMLQVKVDPQKLKRSNLTTVSPSQSQHPTISLTQDQVKAKGLASPVSSILSPVRSSTPTNAVPIAKPLSVPTITVQVPKKAVKRPASEVPVKMSLVLEQLECHKKMASSPDCTRSFNCVRDAIRRLVPFHTCNIPNVKQEAFDESEKIFEKIATRIVSRTRAMVDKYHLLCLRDSTRDSCSAEMVMIERMFLQKEKAKLAEDKAKLKENPELIQEYFPHRFSSQGKRSAGSNDEDVSDTGSQPKTIQLDSYFKSGVETDSSAYDPNLSVDSPLININVESSHSFLSTGDSDCQSSTGGRFLSHDSTCSPVSAKRRKGASEDANSHDSSEEILLQEAVESILT